VTNVVGLFWQNVGLFWQNVGLFWQNVEAVEHGQYSILLGTSRGGTGSCLQEPYILHLRSLYSTKGVLNFAKKSLICCQKSPTLYTLPMGAQLRVIKSPTFYLTIPLVYQKSPVFSQKSPICCQKTPISCPKSPTFYYKSPIFCQKGALYQKIPACL